MGQGRCRQVLRSVIGKNGDLSFPITERFQPVELRPKLLLPTATGWRKSGKQAVRPFYGFSYHQGKIARDPKEFSVLLLIHEKWKQGVNANAIATYLNANKIPSRCNNEWHLDRLNHWVQVATSRILWESRASAWGSPHFWSEKRKISETEHR